jgi:hypothetical protein
MGQFLHGCLLFFAVWLPEVSRKLQALTKRSLKNEIRGGQISGDP